MTEKMVMVFSTIYKLNSKFWIIVYKGHNLNRSEPCHDRQTNNAAEIQAVTEAIKIAKNNDMKAILIHTDSNFLIDCVTKVIRSKSMLFFFSIEIICYSSNGSELQNAYYVHHSKFLSADSNYKKN